MEIRYFESVTREYMLSVFEDDEDEKRKEFLKNKIKIMLMNSGMKSFPDRYLYENAGAAANAIGGNGVPFAIEYFRKLCSWKNEQFGDDAATYYKRAIESLNSYRLAKIRKEAPEQIAFHASQYMSFAKSFSSWVQQTMQPY